MIYVWKEREERRAIAREHYRRYRERVETAQCTEVNPNDLAAVLAA